MEIPNFFGKNIRKHISEDTSKKDQNQFLQALAAQDMFQGNLNVNLQTKAKEWILANFNLSKLQEDIIQSYTEQLTLSLIRSARIVQNL
jgi:hypothetical protein